ncbi:MAG: NADH-quinone oxidoreductase subunit L [Candidatus Eremiobacteraeota bacterium]|nr:NADH-quinone oxidoreductase subunit L [Candidatus Eremiobacteraeota bacterium]
MGSVAYPLVVALWLLPLAGAVLCWAFGPRLRSACGWLAAGLVGVSFLLAVASWGSATQNLGGVLGAHQPLVSWMPGFDFGLLLDPLSLIWTFIITGVGFLIVFYSIGYMDGDRAFARFFAYMSFFMFAMLTLVLSDNFVGLLVGWGLVGLASYFLIGFWFERRSAVAAARKAFVINVVGDVGMMFAIFLIVANVHSIGFGDVFAAAPGLSDKLVFAICLALFIGAAAKSAQVPLHTWLPDAMEGPTPVSALIHAATMVTAGVYLVARCAPLWNHSGSAQLLVATIGGVTALGGAILGTAQWDIKRILAYSTMSQIGYMIMGVGVGAYEGGVAHFFTHAFFKAQLFLGAGLVIHALHNEQDIRAMGGLWRRMPFAFWVMLTGVLSICGVPGFSGFFSKDAVIYGALQHGHPWIYAVDIVTAGITAYYMFRMLFVAFLGEYRGEAAPDRAGRESEHGTHAPGWVMNVPVAVLVVPSVAVGGALMFGGDNSPWSRFFAPLYGTPSSRAIAVPPISEGVTSLVVFLTVIAGFAIAWQRYASRGAQADAPARLRRETERMPAVLTNLFYVDWVIERLIVRPAQRLGELFGRVVDPHVLDGAVRDLVFWARWLGTLVRSFQTGLVRAYALILVAGAACFVVYYAVAAGLR